MDFQDNYQSGGFAGSNVNKNLILPTPTPNLQSFDDFIEQQNNPPETPEQQELNKKTFGSKYISDLYNKIDFGDLPVKNETDFVNALLFENGFAEMVHGLAGEKEIFSTFRDQLDNEIYSDNNIYIDPDIPDDSRDALARAYTNPGTKFYDGSYTFLPTDKWIKDAVASNDDGIYKNPNNPDEYVLVKDGKYKRVRDGKEDGLVTNIINPVVKGALKAIGSTFDLIPEITSDVFGDGTAFADDVTNVFGNFMDEGSISNLSYDKRDLSPEEFQNLGFFEKQAYGMGQFFDSETLLNWDWIKSDEGIQTLSSTMELVGPGIAGAKLASKLGVVALGSKAGGLVDDVVKSAINNGKRFSYGQQIGANVGKLVGYSIPATMLESRMEALQTYETKHDLYSQETLPDGTPNPDYIANEDERKERANAAATEHFWLGIPNLLATNALEGAAMMLPFGRLKAFGAIGKAAGVATGFGLGAVSEGFEELTQWGIQDYIDDKYSISGKEEKKDSFFEGLFDSWGRSIKGFIDDPEASTSFYTGLGMGGTQALAASGAAKAQEQIYNLNNKDKRALVLASKDSGFGVFDIDDKGDPTINYEKISGAAKYNADLTANLHLTSNINFDDAVSSTDKLSILLGERYSSLIQNALQNDTEGILRNLSKEEFVDFMRNELYRGFRLSPEEYNKKNFQGIRYYDWNKINDETVDTVLNYVYESKFNTDKVNTKEDLSSLGTADSFRHDRANTGNPELDKIINSKLSGIGIGGMLTRSRLGKHLTRVDSIPEDANKSDYIEYRGTPYKINDTKNKEHVMDLLKVDAKYRELFADISSYSGTELTEENKKKQEDLLKRFLEVKRYNDDKKEFARNTVGERVKKAQDTAASTLKKAKGLTIDKISGLFGKKKSTEAAQEEQQKQQQADENKASTPETPVNVTPPVAPAGTSTTPTPEPEPSAGGPGLPPLPPNLPTDGEEVIEGGDNDGDTLLKDPTEIVINGTTIKLNEGETIQQRRDRGTPEEQKLIDEYFSDLDGNLPNNIDDNFDYFDEFGQPGESFDGSADEYTGEDTGEDINLENNPSSPKGPTVPTGGGTFEDDLSDQVVDENTTVVIINKTPQKFVRTDGNSFTIIPSINPNEATLNERAKNDIGNSIAYLFQDSVMETDNNETFIDLLKGETNKGTKLAFNRATNDAVFRNNEKAIEAYNLYRKGVDTLFGDNKSINLTILDRISPDDPKGSVTVQLFKSDFDKVQVHVDGAPAATTMLHEPLWFLKRIDNGHYDNGEYFPTGAVGISIKNHLDYRRKLVAEIDASESKVVSGVITNKRFSNFDYVRDLDENGEFKSSNISNNINTNNNNLNDKTSRRNDHAFLLDTNSSETHPSKRNRSGIPLIHGKDISNSDVVVITVRNESGGTSKMKVSVNRNLVSKQNNKGIFMILDDGTGGYRAYPANKGQINNTIKRTVSEVIAAILNTKLEGAIVSPALVELNKNLSEVDQFLYKGTTTLDIQKAKNYINKFIQTHENVYDVPFNKKALFNRLPISVNATTGKVFIFKSEVRLPGATGKRSAISHETISKEIDKAFNYSKTRRYTLPFTAALPDKNNSYNFNIPVINGDKIQIINYDDLIREHYYSGIEIVNTGQSEKSRIGYVSERQFILNTAFGEEAQNPVVSDDTTKVPLTNIDEGTSGNTKVIDDQTQQNPETNIDPRTTEIVSRREKSYESINFVDTSNENEIGEAYFELTIYAAPGKTISGEDLDVVRPKDIVNATTRKIRLDVKENQDENDIINQLKAEADGVYNAEIEAINGYTSVDQTVPGIEADDTSLMDLLGGEIDKIVGEEPLISKEEFKAAFGSTKKAEDVNEEDDDFTLDFRDISKILINDNVIPVSNLMFLNDLQLSIMGEISESILLKTLGVDQDGEISTLVKKIILSKIEALSEQYKLASKNNLSYIHENKKDVTLDDIRVLLRGTTSNGKRYHRIFAERIYNAVNDLLDMDQQKEAKLSDLQNEIQENQNRSQLTEDSNRLFNPTKKISKKEKLLYNSTVKEIDPTGTGLFTTYYNYKEIKPVIINILSISNDQYYNPNTGEALEILRKVGEQNIIKDGEGNIIQDHWANALYNKLTDTKTYPAETLETMRQQVLVFNRMIEANYMQLYKENGEYRLYSITASFNERQIRDQILENINELNGILPTALESKKVNSISTVLEAIGFDTKDLNISKLNAVGDPAYFEKAVITEITGKPDRRGDNNKEFGNITRVARFISEFRKTPILTTIDNSKSVGLFITPSQLGEDLAKFKANKENKESFKHVSAQSTLAFFQSDKELNYAIAALAFKSGQDEKLSELTETEYIQSAFQMFFSDRQNMRPWYISGTPADGGTNYLVQFDMKPFKQVNLQLALPEEDLYLYNNLIKPDLDRMSSPFMHDGVDFIDLANYAPMRFFATEDAFMNDKIKLSDGKFAEEHYYAKLSEIRSVPKAKRAQAAKQANEFFKAEITKYLEKEENKTKLLNNLKTVIIDRRKDLLSTLGDTGFFMEDAEKWEQLTKKQQDLDYTHGIHKSLLGSEAINRFMSQVNLSIQSNPSAIKRTLLDNIIINYMVFHNNMQYIFQGDPAQYTKGYNPQNDQQSYDSFLGNLFKRLKSNISPRDIGNDSVTAISSKGLKALRKNKFDPKNKEHVYTKTTVSHVFAKDIKIPGLNLSGIMDVMESDLSYERFNFPQEVTKEAYDNYSTKQKLDTILKYVKDPAEKFPEVKDYFRVPIADAQEFWNYRYGLDFLQEQGQITFDQKLGIINKVESNTIQKEDYKYLGIEKPLHVGTRDITDVDGNKWRVRDYIKSSAKFLYPQLVKDTEWEAIYNNMEKNEVDALTFNSGIKVGEPAESVNLFNNDGTYTNADLSDIYHLESKFKGKQLNIPTDLHTEISHPAQPDKKIGGGLEHMELEDGTPMMKLINDQEKVKSDIRRIEKENLRRKLSTSDGNLDLKKLHKMLQEELNSRGFEQNAKDVVKLMEQIDPDGNITDVLMYPLHASTSPKRFDALLASIVTKGGISKGKTPGFGIPQVASIGFKAKPTIKEFGDITNEAIISVGGWDLSKGLSHYSVGTEHNPKGLAEIIIPWIFPYPIDTFIKGGKIDLDKLPEELLEGLGYRIPNQSYSSDMIFKIVGFTTDPNSLFVPHEIAIQMGADYDIDKLYAMLPDIEPVFKVNNVTSNKSQLSARLKNILNKIDVIQNDALVIGNNKKQLSKLKKNLSTGDISKDVISEFKDAVENTTNTLLTDLREDVEKLEKALEKSIPDGFKKSKSPLGKANNELHAIRMRMFSDQNVKKKSLEALDTGINNWFDWFNSQFKAGVDLTRRKQEYTNFVYQASKSDNARVGKDGIGVFALNGSTIKLFSGRNVKIADKIQGGRKKIQYTPMAISAGKDENGNPIIAVNDEYISSKYDIISNQQLKQIFENGFEGKQLVTYLDENNEKQYTLIDLYAEAEQVKMYVDNLIMGNLTDESLTGLPVVLADRDTVNEMVETMLRDKKKAEFSLFGDDEKEISGPTAETKINIYAGTNENADSQSSSETTDQNTYRGIPIVDVTDIVTQEGTSGAASFDINDNTIRVNRRLIRQKFNEKAWTNPRKLMEMMHGEEIESYAEALPEDIFKTYEEFEEFVIEHEYQHTLLRREDFDAGKEITSTTKPTFSYKNREIETHFKLSPDQEQALKELIDFRNDRGNNLYMLQGAAGTGKTSIIGYLQNYLGESFLYSAPTHAATVQLAFATYKTGNRIFPITVKASMYRNKDSKLMTLSKKAKEKIGFGKVIVVDETSMLAKSDYNNILELSQQGYKIIFMGDKKQIPEISTGNERAKSISPAFTDLPSSNLNEIHRTSNNKLKAVLQKIRDSINYKLYQTTENTPSLNFYDLEPDFNDDHKDTVISDPENTMYIGYTNGVVKGKNAAVRRLLGRSGTVKVGDIVTGYLGYASKQVEKGNLANSVNFTIKGVTEVRPGKYRLSVSSAKLNQLKEDGFTELPSTYQTNYMPLSDYDALETPATEDDYDTNNAEVSNQMAMIHSAFLNFKKDLRLYNAYLDEITAVQKYFMNVDLGHDYVYDPSQNKMLPYDKYDKTKQVLRDVARRNGLINQKGEFDSHLDKLIVEKGIDYGHAITVHKSQGSSIDNVFFDASTIPEKTDIDLFQGNEQISTERQSLAYVGLSRSVKRLSVYKGRAPFVKVNTSNISETDPKPEASENITSTKGEYESEINRRALTEIENRKKEKQVQKDNELKDKVVGFYDGEKIVLNKDHKKFGTGALVHEHVHPLLNDLDSIINGFFDGATTTTKEIAIAKKTKENLYNEAARLLGAFTIAGIKGEAVYRNLPEEKFKNEVITRAVELTSNKITKDNKSFIDALKDFISFMVKHIRSRFFRAVIQNKSVSAKDLEPIVGINQLASVYLMSGAAKLTMDRKGNLRKGTGKSTEFDKIMEPLSDLNNIKNIVDNNSFENFTKFYDHKKYNSVIEHSKPNLVEKADNNTVYENITVDGANKVAELLASGITPDTVNIAAAMLHDGWNPEHITIVLNNPLLKEYYARMKAKDIIDGFSLENRQMVLEDIKTKYLPDELINLDLTNDNFYTEEYSNDQRVIIPKYVIDIDKMYDRKRGLHNSDPISLEKQNKETLKHQFEALLNTLMYQETTKELVTVSNIFNINSNGGTKSFIHDQSLYETAEEILATNKVGIYDLGSVTDDSYMGTVLSNFIEMRDLISSQQGLSVITDYKETVDNFVKHYKDFYSVGEFTDYKKKQIINAFSSALPEYIKNKIFSSLPDKDNIEYTKYKLLAVVDFDGNPNPDNLGDIIDRIQTDMRKNPNHILNIEKTLFNAFETKFENNYKVVQFNTGRIAPNIKDNIKTNLLDLYNNPKDLFKDKPGYTTKTLIDDLFDYSIVTGANSGPFKFFDYMPSELLLKNFAKAEREQILDFKNSFKTADDHLDFFMSVLLNNPDMLPNLDKLPKGYKGRVYKKSYYNKEKKSFDYHIYTVKKVKNAQTGVEEAAAGKVLPKITDKTKIKQYTIKFDLDPTSAIGIKNGYNIITGGNRKALQVPSPKIYESDNKQTIELFQKDTSENRNIAKHAFGDTIVNPELRAIYKDIVQDANIESVGIEFVDLIDNNEANYGRYNRKAHTIQISTKAMMTGKYSLADILVHEYTHVQMSDMVDIYENIKLGRIKKESIGNEAYDQMKFLDSVFETYKQAHPNAIASQNLDEFISEVRRSQDVRNNIKAFPEKLLRRVITAITDLIKNVLGLSNNQKINGQQIHDGTLDFISRLSKNRIIIYTNGYDTYQFTGTIDGIILGGTLNREILVDPAKALTEVLSNNAYKSYNLVSDQAEGIYNPDVERIKPMSYNLTATEFNKKMKEIKVIMDDPSLNHEDLINIIQRRFNELVYFSELYKGILRKSSDRTELSNAKKALKLVENDIDKIMIHLEKAVDAKNTKDRMDYVDSVIDAVSDVVKSETTNPIEIMTANDFLTRLTDIFDPKKTNLNVYTDDDVADIEFITEEAKQDPEIAYKYNEQVARIVALNKKLMDKTLLTVEQEAKRKDEFARVDFNPDSDNNNRDLSWFEKWTMTADRTGDDFLNWWMVLNNDVEAAYKQDISIKFDEITKVQNRLIPTLERYYSNLSPGKELDNYHKFGIYSVMLDEYGNVKMPYSPTYFDAINKFKSKIKDAENIWKNAAPSERSAKYKKLKQAKDKYAEFMSDSNYTKRSEIEDAMRKETNPSKLKQLQRVLDKYDIYRSAHLEKFEADYDVFSEDLKEETLTVTDESGVKTDVKKSVRRQQLEFIEENYPYQDLNDIKAFVKSKLNLDYNYSTDGSNLVRRSVSTDAIISSIPRKYTYVYSVPKQEFWNDMSFMDTPEIAEFYNLYVETMKEIRDNLPTRFSEELRLSDIPFISRNVLNYSLKDLITKPDVRNTLYKDYIAGFTLKDKYLDQDNFGENYNDNIVNTRFGQLNAFSKNKAVQERLITRLKAEGLPFIDEFGKVNPRRANRIKGTYSKEYLDIEQDVRNEVDTELMEMKSFDLGKVVEMYYIEAMAYKHKMKEINTLNLVKDAALKTWKSRTNKAGEVDPLNDKINMLLDNDKILKGIPARKVIKEKYLSMLGKKYSVLEEKRKIELEETVKILEQELIDVKNDTIQTENTLMYIENLEQEIKKRKDEIDNLGAEVNVGNIMRKVLAFDIARNLWGNPRSSIGNVIMGIISNRLEAADGRVFGMDSYKKMFDKIYMKSEITPFLAGTFGGLLLGVTGGLIGAGFGFAVGYGINRLMHRRAKDPETTTVFNMMGMFDILQQQAHEQKLETVNDRSSNTYKNKFLRSDAAELLREPMMFITKSEIPHQAVVLGAILDSTYILDPDNIDGDNYITLLSYLTKVGSEGMKFRADYDKMIYLRLNTAQGQVVTEVPLKILLERTATTAAAVAAKTHGNYRLNTKQLAKLDDRTVLATEFKTWAAEGFAGRYEDKKVNRTISVSLTSSKYQNADENYYTKGMVQTSFEKLGTPLTLGLNILQPSFNNVLWGTIGAFGSSTLLGASAAIVAPLLTVGTTVGGLYYLHGKGHEQTVDKGVQRAFYKALGGRLFKKLMTAAYYKKFSEVDYNGQTIDANEYLDRVLSKEDSANIRKLIEQTGMLAFYSMMYYALLATKIASKDDDDDDVQLEQKYINFALNTMGRTMLDIQSYTNAGDIISKYGEFDKVSPALTLGPQTWEAASSFATYVFSGGTEGVYERREGQYKKGDPKFIKKVKKILPFTRTYDSFISSTEQEFQMFKGNIGR